MIDKKQYFKRYYQLNKVELKSSIAQWQTENKEKVSAYKKKCKDKQKLLLREIINSIKLNSQCDCGENCPVCLEFHHLKNKDAIIGRLVSNAVTADKLKHEIDKCKVVCSNCHRKLHCDKPSRDRTYKFKIVYETKTKHGCHFCNENYYACLDFHHLRDKIETIGHMTKQKKYTLDDIKNEIQKCIVVCSNCHRKLHDGLLHI